MSNCFALAFGESEDESTPRAQATEETNVSAGASAHEVLCTTCNHESCALSKMLRHKAQLAKLPPAQLWLAEEDCNWADIMEAEERPVDPWVTELLALAAAQLADGAEPAPAPVTIPFVENTDVWARNPNGSIMCCRNHAHEGVKGHRAPHRTVLIVNADGNNEERTYEAGCEKFDASELCTLSKGAQAGKRVAHMGEPEWDEAEPRPTFELSRPGSAAFGGGGGGGGDNWRSGASTPQQNWRSGASTPQQRPQRPCCTNPRCRLPSGQQMSNHTLETCGKPGGGAYKGRN